MTKTRIYDVYIKNGNRWKHEIRTFFPFTKKQYLERGVVAKILPCRQWAFFSRDVENLVRVPYYEGYSSGYWRGLQSRLIHRW